MSGLRRCGATPAGAARRPLLVETGVAVSSSCADEGVRCGWLSCTDDGFCTSRPPRWMARGSEKTLPCPTDSPGREVRPFPLSAAASCCVRKDAHEGHDL
jgi:hypothetical protein